MAMPAIDGELSRPLLMSPANGPCWLANDAKNIADLICPSDHARGAYLWLDILAGDQEAALSAIELAPNSHRGRIVRVAYRANVPNPAFRELVLSAWNHDHEWLLHAAGGPGARHNTLMLWFDRAAFDVSRLPAIVTAYRGVVLPDHLPWQMAVIGFAWTQSLETATFFTGDYWRNRGVGGQSVVVRAQIARRFIKAAIDEREELEIVVFATPLELGTLKLIAEPRIKELAS
jgi:hypothetical protein